MQDSITQKQGSPQYNGNRKVGRHVGFVSACRRLIAGHADKHRQNTYRVDQGKKSHEKFDTLKNLTVIGSRRTPHNMPVKDGQDWALMYWNCHFYATPFLSIYHQIYNKKQC